MTKRKKKQARRVVAMVIAGGIVAMALLSLVVAIASHVRHQYFPDKDDLDYGKITVKPPDIQEQFLTPNVNSRPGKELKQVRGIVVHYTANPGTDAQANRNYFEGRKDEPDKRANKVSSHFIIGLDGTIIQCIPLDEIAYASNDRNKDTVSIECCHPGKGGKFTHKTYQSLVYLCAWLCDTYELEKDSIIRHYDVTGKICPKYYVKHQGAWDNFKEAVWQCLKEEESS